MTNIADPDQLTSGEANWSGSTMFAKTGHIRVQQDKESMDIIVCVYEQRMPRSGCTDVHADLALHCLAMTRTVFIGCESYDNTRMVSKV